MWYTLRSGHRLHEHCDISYTVNLEDCMQGWQNNWLTRNDQWMSIDDLEGHADERSDSVNS